MWKRIPARTAELCVCHRPDGTVEFYPGTGPMPPAFAPTEGAEYTDAATGHHYRWEA